MDEVKSYYDNETHGRKLDILRFQTEMEKHQDEIKKLKEKKDKERKREIIDDREPTVKTSHSEAKAAENRALLAELQKKANILT